MEESSSSSSSILSIWAAMNSWFTPTVLFILLNLMIATIFFTSNLPNQKPEDLKEKSQDPHRSNDPKPTRSPSILHRLKSINLYPHRSQQDSSPVNTHFDFNQIRFDQDVAAAASAAEAAAEEAAAEADFAALNQTHEVKLPNVETHFVREPQPTVETVTTHYSFDPTRIDNGEVEAHEEENDEFKSLDEVYSMLGIGHVSRTTSDTKPASGELPRRLPAKMKKSASMKSAFSHFEEDEIVEARRPETVRAKPAAKMTEEDDVEVDAKADDFINKFKHQLKLQRIDSIIRYKDVITRGTAK